MTTPRSGRRGVRLATGGAPRASRRPYRDREPPQPAPAAAALAAGAARCRSITSHKHDLPILAGFTVLSAFEVVAVDLVVHRWPSVRIPLLVLGIWGVAFLVGMLAGLVTLPHAVGPDGIRVRNGTEIDVALLWDDVHTVTRHRTVEQDERALVRTEPDGRLSLHMRVQGETNIEIALHEPLPVRLPHGTEAVGSVHLYSDDPTAFMAGERRY